MEKSESPSARPCGICAGIQRIRGGHVDNLIAELEHCYVVLGDSQLYRGYCIALAKRHFTELHLMPPVEARALFDELMLVGSAVFSVVKPGKLNYECLGNLEPHVHWHVFPRQSTDKDPAAPVWRYPETLERHELDSRDKADLIRTLQAEIKRLAAARR